jgi:hypothetical protein
MSIIYNRRLVASPFIIVPIALIDKEAALLIGPKQISQRSDTLIQTLYSFIAKQLVGCPVIAQILPYEGSTLIATTIQTTVRDGASGRFGLKLTFGALLHHSVLFSHSAICTKVFSLMDQYFRDAFGATVSVEGANKIVAIFQQKDQSTENLINGDKTELLLNEFESEFGTIQQTSLSLRQRIGMFFKSTKLHKFQRQRIGNKIEGIERFWRSVDEILGEGRKSQASSVPHDREVVSINIPTYVIVELKKVAKSNEMSYKELLELYIHQELIQDLLESNSERIYSNVTEALTRHAQSQEVIAEIMQEIRAKELPTKK